MSAQSGQKKKERKPFGVVVKFILAAGAVAAAIASIIGLVRLLTPDDEARLHAQISQVQVDPKVPLAEFLDRSGEGAPPSGRETASAAVFVSASMAQTQPRTMVPPPPVEPPPVAPVPPPPPVDPPPPVAPPPPPVSMSAGDLLSKLGKCRTTRSSCSRSMRRMCRPPRCLPT